MPPTTFVNGVQRSQIRRSLFEVLRTINPTNTPTGSTTTFGSPQVFVYDSWKSAGQLPDLPGIQLRFDTEEFSGQQSNRLRGALQFELMLVVGEEADRVSAALDTLIDDVIAVLYTASRSRNVSGDAFSYGIELLSAREQAPSEEQRREYVMRWQIRYARRLVITRTP